MGLKSQNYLLILGSLLIAVNSAFSSDFVPVYLWQTSKLGQNVPALPRVTTDAFSELIRERLNKDAVLVAFAEPNLSPEDFNSVTQSGERVFSRLAEVRVDAATAYLPQVQKPIGTLLKLFDGDVATVSARDFKLENIKTSAVIIDLNDVQEDEDRNQMLTRHDKIIADIYEQLSQKYTNVVAVFTGRQASWIVPKEVLSRKVRDTENTSGWIVKHGNLLMYAAEIPVFKNNGNSQQLAAEYAVTNVSSEGDRMTATLEAVGTPDSTIRITFSIKSGYWSFVSLALEINGSTHDFKVPPRLFPPSTFSYQCTNQIFYVNTSKSTSLTFKSLQIQPFQQEQTVNRFGDPYFCVGFTSPAIWSGIFVAFILATIMAIGLMMMMDMKTMDRFDDPKGKTIIINVSE